MRTPNKSSDPAAIWAVATHAVHDWILFTGPENPAVEGAMRIIRGREHLAESTRQLESWFFEQLTVDPKVPGPFSDVAHGVLRTMLGLVDWELIVRAMRERED